VEVSKEVKEAAHRVAQLQKAMRILANVKGAIERPGGRAGGGRGGGREVSAAANEETRDGTRPAPAPFPCPLVGNGGS
jgi:hypothetical protein